MQPAKLKGVTSILRKRIQNTYWNVYLIRK